MYRMGLMALIASDIPGINRDKLEFLVSFSSYCLFILFFFLSFPLWLRLNDAWNCFCIFVFYSLLAGVWKWRLFMTLQRVKILPYAFQLIPYFYSGKGKICCHFCKRILLAVAQLFDYFVICHCCKKLSSNQLTQALIFNDQAQAIYYSDHSSSCC